MKRIFDESTPFKSVRIASPAPSKFAKLDLLIGQGLIRKQSCKHREPKKHFYLYER